MKGHESVYFDMCLKTYIKHVSFLRVIAFFAVFTASPLLNGQSIYYLEFPYSKDPYAGASFHTLLHHQASSLKTKLLPATVFTKHNKLSGLGNILYRTALLSSLDFYLTYIPVINQHEYFGHLSRAKQHHAGFHRYEVYFFPPIGGKAWWGSHLDFQPSDEERTLEIAGGIESTNILANCIRQHILMEDKMNYSTSLFLLGANSDLITYLIFEDESSSNDIDNYLMQINLHRSRPDHLKKEDLLFPAALSFFCDYLTIRSFSNILYNYIFRGIHESTNLMLHVNDAFSFLPGLEYLLTPVGPEISFRSFFNVKGKYFMFSVGHGYPWDIDYGALTLSYYRVNIIPDLVFADVGLRVWNEPAFAIHDKYGNEVNVAQFGGLTSADFYCRLPIHGCGKYQPLIKVGVSAKTPGYTCGYPLHKTIGVNVGVGYYLR